MITKDEVERAEEIQQEMLELLNEFEQILRQSDNRMLLERFKAYPRGHIQMAITDESDYVGSDMFTLKSLAQDLQDEVVLEDGEDD